MSAPRDSHAKNAHAQGLFDGIASSYEGPAQLFSFFQYRRWRHFLVSRLRVSPETLVLDVCTGTGLVASDIAGRARCRVVGVDLSAAMIEQARRNLKRPRSTNDTPAVSLVKGRAESLPFAESSFDAVVFTYLLRYVEDPVMTIPRRRERPDPSAAERPDETRKRGLGSVLDEPSLPRRNGSG